MQVMISFLQPWFRRKPATISDLNTLTNSLVTPQTTWNEYLPRIFQMSRCRNNCLGLGCYLPYIGYVDHILVKKVVPFHVPCVKSDLIGRINCYMFNYLLRPSIPSGWEGGMSYYSIPAEPWKTMHEGVVRDEERQRIKRERTLELEEQQRLQMEYEKVQPVSRSDGR